MSKLKDLFKNQEDALYKKFSTKDSAGQGIIPDQLKFSEPFIEKKPNDADRNAKAIDSRALPIVSSAEHVVRIGKFLTSPRGITFLIKQRLLRTQLARPDLKTPIKIGLEEIKLSAEILASLAPPVRGERFGSSTFGDEDEYYTKSGLTTPLGSVISNDGSSDRLDKKRGMTNYSDPINASGIIDTDDDKLINEMKGLDLIPFFFKDIVNKKVIFFRATLNGLNESIDPEWNSERYVGRPFKVYYYGGVERNLSFSFTIYPMNAKELISNWKRYNYLVGLCYPSGYVDSETGDAADKSNLGYIQPPFIEFTIGNYFKDQPAIITGIAMSVPDETGWEIGGTRSANISTSNEGTTISTLNQLKNAAVAQVKSAFNTTTGKYTVGEKVRDPDDTVEAENTKYKLPHMIEVTVSLTILEKKLRKTGDLLYGFGKEKT